MDKVMKFGLIVAMASCLCMFEHIAEAGQRTKSVTIVQQSNAPMNKADVDAAYNAGYQQAVQMQSQSRQVSTNESPVPLLATESASSQPASTLQYKANVGQGVCPCSGTSVCSCDSNCKCRGGNQVSVAASMRSSQSTTNGFQVPNTMSYNGRTNFGNPAMYNSVDFSTIARQDGQRIGGYTFRSTTRTRSR